MNRPAALFLSPFLPYSTGHGGGLRLHNLLGSLSERYDVHVLCLARPWERPYEERARSLCRELTTVPVDDLPIPVPSGASKIAHLFWPALPDHGRAVDETVYPLRLDDILARRKFDLGLAAYFSLAHLVPGRKSAADRWVFDSINMPMTDNRLAARRAGSFRAKLYYLSQARKCREQMRALEGEFDAVLSVSESEKRLLESYMPRTRVLNIPIGLNLKDIPFHPLPSRTRNTVVYVGYYAMDQNVEAAKELCRDVMPLVWEKRPDARLELIGPYPDRIKFLEVPNKVTARGVLAAPFADGRVLAAPIRLGSGFKTKIAGALAAGLPAVTTPEGNESIGARPGAEILVADDPRSFADGVLRLLSDDALAEALSRGGRAFVEDRLDWTTNIRPLWDFLEGK